MLEVAVQFVRPSNADGPDRLEVAEPVRFGVPLPQAAMRRPVAKLISPDGREAAAQVRVTARWPDVSARWILIDAVLPRESPIGKEGNWICRLSEGGQAEPSAGTGIADRRGSLEWDVRGGWNFRPPDQAPLSQAVFFTWDLQDDTGRPLRPAKAVRIERLDGPVVQMERWEGRCTAPFRLRPSRVGRNLVWRMAWEFFPTADLMRVRLTLRNQGRARHRGGCWDLGDPGSVLLKDFTLRIRPAEPARAWVCRVRDGGILRVLAGEFPASVNPGGAPNGNHPDVLIYQDSSGGENWRSYNHVNAQGRIPCSFRGFRLSTPHGTWEGLRAEPIVGLRTRDGWWLAAVPEFWQRFPKALRLSARELALGILPEEWGDRHELQGGEQVTTTVCLRWDSDVADSQAGDRRTLQSTDTLPHPLQAICDWEPSRAVEIADVLVPPAVYAELPVADFARAGLRGESGLLPNREKADEYGWRHFGDVYADHEARYFHGQAPHVSHYNNQFDLLLGTILQGLCGRSVEWDAILHPLARHVIDIDVYHTSRDRAPFNGGLFWLTDHYRTAHTCTHRAFSRKNADRPGYGGGPSSEHNYTTGLLMYHFLFGDDDARETVLSLADWVIAMEDGGRTPFFLIDAGPTGAATATSEADYHGPGRAAANSINALLDGWLVSGESRYLDFAERLLRRTVHPADDIRTRRLHDAERRWSYAMYFEITARYLQLKDAWNLHDDAYAYVARSLLHYARWMLEHERPFLDRRDELEYPTEVWAAQSLRQANVLWAASRLAEKDLRGRLRERAEAWTAQAWRDLLAFEHPINARTLAVVLTAALRGACHRSAPPLPLPRAEEHDSPPPEPFLPQRTRVKRALRKPGVLVPVLMRACYPPNLIRLLNLLRRWRN
ncbi:MAG: hypothetical protein Kow0040_23370 [Thermogutta sp.]